MLYGAVVFDLDGTLMLSLDVKVKSAGALWCETFSLVSRDAVEAAYRHHSGAPRRQLFNKIAADVLGRQILIGMVIIFR